MFSYISQKYLLYLQNVHINFLRVSKMFTCLQNVLRALRMFTCFQNVYASFDISQRFTCFQNISVYISILTKSTQFNFVQKKRLILFKDV
jgi:hypothetical protein